MGQITALNCDNSGAPTAGQTLPGLGRPIARDIAFRKEYRLPC